MPEDVQRTRTKHLVIRLNDAERAMLDRVAKRMALSASEAVRHLVRRADDELRLERTPRGRR